jgi:UDP-glucose 4-epimerase
MGHIKAVDKIANSKGVFTYNLGIGISYTVLDVVNNFIEATGKEISYEIADRRSGDIDVCFADSTKALDELGWKTKYDLYNMCLDSWNRQKNNSSGYGK